MTSLTTEKANVHQAVPFFMVSSMEASLEVYRDGLGFVMTRHWIKEQVPRHIPLFLWS